MPVHSSLERLTGAPSMRRSLTALQGRPHALFILPTTRRALRFARELCGIRRCLVTATPIVQQREWGLEPYARTPAQIVTELPRCPQLPVSIISFPDAVAGEGDSFVSLRFLDDERAFSILEGLLVLRCRPLVYGMRSKHLPGAFQLRPIVYDDLLGARAHEVALLPLMTRLLSQLESELAKPPDDWLAFRCFDLKIPSVFDRRIREELREIESLLRLAMLASCHARSIEALSPVLEGVTRRLRGGGHIRETLH